MGSGSESLAREIRAEVRTLRGGRSAERARAAGMKPMADEKALLDGADFFLSILPPGEAENLARRLAPALAALAKKPIYVDCNAVSPQTAERVAAIIEPTGARFVDGGIIGGPPRPGYSPAIYASGAAVGETAVLLADRLAAPIGAQDVPYGITKGHHRAGIVSWCSAPMRFVRRALVANCRRASRKSSNTSPPVSRGCTTRPIAGWPDGEISDPRLLGRRTSMPRLPALGRSPPPRRKPLLVPTADQSLTGCWGITAAQRI